LDRDRITVLVYHGDRYEGCRMGYGCQHFVHCILKKDYVGLSPDLQTAILYATIGHELSHSALEFERGLLWRILLQIAKIVCLKLPIVDEIAVDKDVIRRGLGQHLDDTIMHMRRG